jgi:hypothetical protein
MNRNLLEETIEVLAKHGKTPADVKFVTDEVCICTWDDFALGANKSYASGYGSNEVIRELHIVGDTWWLERGEYDGAEWWEYKERPTQKVAGSVHIWVAE